MSSDMDFFWSPYEDFGNPGFDLITGGKVFLAGRILAIPLFKNTFDDRL